VVNVEQRDLVKCLFELLPDSERGLLEMRFFHNMSYRRMGHEFGVSRECVRFAVEKILKECRRIMRYIDFGKTKGELVAIPVINEKSLLFDHDEKKRLKLVAEKEERKKLRKAIPGVPTHFIEYCLKHHGSSWRYRVENGLYVHPFFKEYYYNNKEKFLKCG